MSDADKSSAPSDVEDDANDETLENIEEEADKLSNEIEDSDNRALEGLEADQEDETERISKLEPGELEEEDKEKDFDADDEKDDESPEDYAGVELPTEFSNVSADLRPAVDRLQEERARARARAHRFGKPYVEPNPYNFLTRTEVRRLRVQSEKGFVTGFDLFTSAEEEKRRKRAERFGSIAPSVLAATEEPGALTQLEVSGADGRSSEWDARRAKRAERFGTVDVRAKQTAERAAAALLRRPGEAAGKARKEKKDWAADPGVRSGKALLGTGAVREGVLHVTCEKYLQASTSDITRYFAVYHPSWVEWLNGEAVNVIFEDAGTCKRALMGLARPIPKVPDVPQVPEEWRVGVQPLIKGKPDKWGPAGAETTIYLRLARESDSKEKAVATGGARVWGQWLNRKTGGRIPRQHQQQQQGERSLVLDAARQRRKDDTYFQEAGGRAPPRTSDTLVDALSRPLGSKRPRPKSSILQDEEPDAIRRRK